MRSRGSFPYPADVCTCTYNIKTKDQKVRLVLYIYLSLVSKTTFVKKLLVLLHKNLNQQIQSSASTNECTNCSFIFKVMFYLLSYAMWIFKRVRTLRHCTVILYAAETITKYTIDHACISSEVSYVYNSHLHQKANVFAI